MLTDTAIRRLKARDKPYKVTDERGLYLLVSTTGARLWRFNYRFEGKQRTLAFGAYPDVGLAEAREQREAARRALARGDDPAGRPQATVRALVARYEAKRRAEGLAQRTLDKLVLHGGYLVDRLGDKAPSEVTPQDVLAVVRGCEARGAYDTAKRVRALASRIFRFAQAAGEVEVDPAAALQGAVVTRRHRHRSAIFDPERLGGLLRAVDGYDRPVVRLGLQLLLLTMVRPGELRGARWSEVGADLWRVPAERMKMRREHLVPLSAQAQAALGQLRAITEPTGLLLPGNRPGRPISDNTLNAALRSLGYSGDEVVAHGFRRTASTLLHEAGWRSDWIERQLAHVDGTVRGVYNAAQYLDGRREMLQAWANTLDRLRESS